MKKYIFSIAALCATHAIAQENKYEVGIDFGLYTLYSNHGSSTQDNSYYDGYGDASNAGTKLNVGLSFLNNLDKESALRLSYNNLNTNPRNSSFTYQNIFYSGQKNFESNLWDVDFINKYEFGKTTLGLVTGLRYSKTEWSSIWSGYYNQSALKFSGVGPSLGLMFSRSLNDQLSTVAELKYSHLIGKTSATNETSRRGSVSAILDAQVGVQYKQKLQGNTSIVYGLTYSYVNFMRLSNLIRHIDPEDTDYTIAGPKLSVKYLFN